MSDTIESLLAEGRTFPPPADFKKQARVTDAEIYDEANDDFEGFWARQGGRSSTGSRSGTPSSSGTCRSPKVVRRRQAQRLVQLPRSSRRGGHGDKVAYYWEGEPGDTRTITYAQLLDDVSRLANALKALGVRKGDRVNIYLGMVPELPMALLACSRIGAAHSVVFGGFSADSLRDRINDAEAKVLITGDGAWRRGSVVPLKETADAAVAECPSIEKVLVLQRTGAGRAVDRGPRRVVARPRAAAVHRLPARADGLRRPPLSPLHERHHREAQGHHAHDRRLPHAGRVDAQARLRSASPTPTCTGARPTSVGSPATRTSSTGRSRTGTTSVMYEGTPDFPDKDRLWQIVEKYKVSRSSTPRPPRSARS